ncbi:uncharacterized protein F4812DRAFT_461524 [Daldinia caldariorum]|uniref:uncharacterized protein n=1 Tax=Daldinia caldariorum TaxID=326644 RepID=UPI002008D498|nr:uncharacterized protein F4812DRAFT_461524 [Daldinia caldariorum]KAI1465836.1 hypothetical protein F4812DRAFT_461524 [Daldinia caldariorum]
MDLQINQPQPRPSESSSMKRSKSTSPNIDNPPKKSKSLLEKDGPTFQDIASAVPTSPHTTQETNATLSEWCGTLQQADAPEVVESYSYSDMPGRGTTLEGQSMNRPENIPPNFVQDWKVLYLKNLKSSPSPPHFKSAYRYPLDLSRHDNWAPNSDRNNHETAAQDNRKLLYAILGATFDRHYLTPLGAHTLLNPKQDIIFGYDHSAIYDGGYHHAGDNWMFKCIANSYGLSFPYLIVQLEGDSGSLYTAENEAFVGGRVILDITWPILGDQDIVFLHVANPNLTKIYAMWRDVENTSSTGEAVESPVYYVKAIAHFCPWVLEEAKGLRNFIFRLQCWAREDRYPRILEGIKKWKEKGRPLHAFSLKGR